MRSAASEIANANDAIERAIENLEFQGRGVASQTIISHLRNLVEHVAMYAVHGDTDFGDGYYNEIKQAITKLKSNGKTRFLADFHYLLQKVCSHYTPSPDSSERLLLRYLEYLTLMKNFAYDSLGISILTNLESFPYDIDPGLCEYYRSIAAKVDAYMKAFASSIDPERYYVRSAKPFIVHGRLYYETTLIPAHDASSKFDHVLAFSSFRIPTNYSVQLSFKRNSISCLGSRLPITVIDDYHVSIRPCELNSLNEIINGPNNVNVSGTFRSYRSLMLYMTRTGMTLNELVLLPEADYKNAMSHIESSGENCPIHLLLDKSHGFLLQGSAGQNVMKYLLNRPRNRVLRDQRGSIPNNLLGGLYLQNGCIPFDKQPYCTSLLKHEISPNELYSCIDPDGYEDDHLAGIVLQRAKSEGRIYISDADVVGGVSNIDELVARYNAKLYHGHSFRQIIHSMGQLFIKGDEQEVIAIIEEFTELASKGIAGYEAAVCSWLGLDSNLLTIDDENKKKALISMYADTRVALVYGSAGTGKTTMVNIVCNALPDASKIAIANTNPAVESLRRKIKDRKCECETIAKYKANPPECDILIIDECSTVNNKDMYDIIQLHGYKLLLLVGDVRQIEAIRLGNWFALAKEFLPARCIHEFVTPWRASNEDLARLWSAVREGQSDIAEILENCHMTSNLDETILHRASDDEIVLCLNYDGLYGINNMNKMLQTANPNEAHTWKLHVYKVGDPILFNESNRFYPLLYNNLKGRIVAIDDGVEGSMVFDVAVDISMSELSVLGYEGLTFLDCSEGVTYLRFAVTEDVEDDADGEIPKSAIVPFQVSYAVSIHKAQGLDYTSVKLVVSKDVEKRITHNIFYTAITRARERLKIYWSSETQHAVISNLSITNCNRDSQLLSSRSGLMLHP